MTDDNIDRLFVKSSTMVKHFKRRPLSASMTKSIDQTSFGALGTQLLAFNHHSVAPAASDRQSRITIEAMHPIMVRVNAFALHQRMQSVVTEPAAFGDIDLLPNLRHCFAFGLWALGFPFTTTLRASMSNIASANSFLSHAFSLSRSLSRRASDTSMPPNFAHQV